MHQHRASDLGLVVPCERAHQGRGRIADRSETQRQQRARRGVDLADQVVEDFVEQRDLGFAKRGGVHDKEVGDVPRQSAVVADRPRRHGPAHVGENGNGRGHG